MKKKPMTAAAVLARRMKRGLSQAQAAAELAAPTGTYINWEKGRRSVRPYVVLLMRYVDKFGPLET